MFISVSVSETQKKMVGGARRSDINGSRNRNIDMLKSPVDLD